MNNATSSSSHSHHLSPGLIVFLGYLFLAVILWVITNCVRCCSLRSRPRSQLDSPSVLRQDHGGGSASVQVQVIIQRDAVEAAAPAATTFSQTSGAASDDHCAVCLGEYTDGAAVRQLPECRHVFHRTCIELWLRIHSTCPLCRHSTLPAPPVAVSQPPPVAHE